LKRTALGFLRRQEEAEIVEKKAIRSAKASYKKETTKDNDQETPSLHVRFSVLLFPV